MANYKLITFSPTASTTSQLAFTAGATNTVVSSVVASDSSTSTLEVLVKKNGGSVIELAHAQVTTDKPEELLTAPVALEALDELYVRTSRVGANFVISYVEETTVANGTTLGGLVDVDTTGASDGQSLVYDGSASEWVPQTITGGGGGGGATSLDGLSDVAITGSTSGHILRSNGTNFVNVSPTTDIIAEGSINEYYTDAKVDARIAADTTKADASHTHPHTDITDFDTATNALIAAHPDLGDANVNADWNAVSGDAQILNKPALFSGSYTDLTNVPSTFAPSSHTHTHNDIVDFDTEVTSIADARIALGSFANAVHTHTHSDIVDFDTEVNALITAANLAAASHTHVAADITNFNASVDSRIALADSKQLHETGPITTLGETNNGAELIEYATTALTLVPGDIYSLGSTGWEAADNTTASSDKMLAIAANGTDDGSEMLLKGMVKIDLVTSGASVGDAVYLGTGNKATLTAPTSAAYVVKLGRVMGTAGEIFFNPDSTSIKVQ